VGDNAEIEKIIDRTVHTTLTKIGFDLSDPIGLQADMHFLRSARTLYSTAGMRAIMTIVGLITVGLAGGALIAIGRAIKQACN